MHFEASICSGIFGFRDGLELQISGPNAFSVDRRLGELDFASGYGARNTSKAEAAPKYFLRLETAFWCLGDQNTASAVGFSCLGTALSLRCAETQAKCV